MVLLRSYAQYREMPGPGSGSGWVGDGEGEGIFRKETMNEDTI